MKVKLQQQLIKLVWIHSEVLVTMFWKWTLSYVYENVFMGLVFNWRNHSSNAVICDMTAARFCERFFWLMMMTTFPVFAKSWIPESFGLGIPILQKLCHLHPCCGKKLVVSIHWFGYVWMHIRHSTSLFFEKKNFKFPSKLG